MAFPSNILNVLNIMWPCSFQPLITCAQRTFQTKPRSEETSPTTNDCAEFVSSNHFSTSAGWTGQPVNRFQTSAETFYDNKLRIMFLYHTSAEDKTDSTAAGTKSQQTALVNSPCSSLPKNVNTFQHFLFTSLYHCLHLCYQSKAWAQLTFSSFYWNHNSRSVKNGANVRRS